MHAALSLACATHLVNVRGTGSAIGTGPSGRALKSSVGERSSTSADPGSSGSGLTLSRTSLCSALRWGHTSCCGLRFALRIKPVRCRVHHLGSFFVFWVLGRQQYCLFGSAVHVPTHSFDRADAFEVGEGALSKLVAGHVCDYLGFSSDSSFAKRPLAPFKKSHVSLPRLLSVRPGRQTSAGNVALLYLTVWQCVLLSEKDHQPCMFSDCSASICYDTIRGGNDRVHADFVTSMVWYGLAWTPQKERPWAGRGAGRAHGSGLTQSKRPQRTRRIAVSS